VSECVRERERESVCVCVCVSQGKIYRLLGAFAKLRKATINFVICLSVHLCLSVRIERLGSHCTDFPEILYLSVFRKSVEKIEVSL